MEDFYRSQRRRFDVLMEGGEPVGGKWNLDHENREPPPRGQRTLGLVAPWQPPEDEIDERVRADLDALDLPTIGRDGPRWFAVTADEARRALAHFVAHRLPHFGPHEDAMLHDDWPMAHSLLSVPLNLGLLHPLDVARSAEAAFHAGDVALASAEGFVRQVLGWREYMWHLYWHFGPGYLRRNALHAHAPLPDWWTSLDADSVTAACLRAALEGVRDRGWTHHIPRLMVLGNHALQRGYQPRALSDWFREAFVDGFEWVMPTNVIGMSQHADGGLLATKPYASGGAYINRMSDHCGQLRVRPAQAARGRCVPLHRRLLGLGAPAPRPPGRQQPDGPCGGVDAAARGSGGGAGAGVGAGGVLRSPRMAALAVAFRVRRVCRTPGAVASGRLSHAERAVAQRVGLSHLLERVCWSGWLCDASVGCDGRGGAAVRGGRAGRVRTPWRPSHAIPGRHTPCGAVAPAVRGAMLVLAVRWHARGVTRGGRVPAGRPLVAKLVV